MGNPPISISVLTPSSMTIADLFKGDHTGDPSLGVYMGRLGWGLRGTWLVNLHHHSD